MKTETISVSAMLALCGALSCGTDREPVAFGSAADSGGQPLDSSEGNGADAQDGTTQAGGTMMSSGADDDSDGGGILFDLASGDLPPDVDCGCGNSDWSYVYIANSSEGTVSKINTRTLQEEGRYLTRPDGGGSPSRTSVSIDGRSAVVANRHTGIVKIWARPEFCEDHNGTPGIQTSSGGGNVLPWGEDDCIAWYTPFDDMTVQRPVQWTAGGPCHADQKVWTVTGADGWNPGQCGASGMWVHRLNGTTGVVEDTIHLAEADFPCEFTGTGNAVGLGAYGGAVDGEGNFYFHGWGIRKFARVDFETLDVEIFDGGGYGITVDTKGRLWFSSSISRFDYDTKTWLYNNSSSGSGGLGQDLLGRMWAADNAGVVAVDLETLEIQQTVALPSVMGAGAVKGVSADIDGYVWAVRQNDPNAYKIDPETYDYEIFTGLDGPYTYSDMTGGAITNVTCNPEG